MIWDSARKQPKLNSALRLYIENRKTVSLNKRVTTLILAIVLAAFELR